MLYIHDLSRHILRFMGLMLISMNENDIIWFWGIEVVSIFSSKHI
jgi:hypothetical protein